MVAAGGSKGVPILLDRDKVAPNEAFVDKEMKFARQWLYSKGVMMPEEPRNGDYNASHTKSPTWLVV